MQKRPTVRAGESVLRFFTDTLQANARFFSAFRNEYLPEHTLDLLRIPFAEKRAAKLLGAVRRAGGDGLSSAVRGGEEKIREYANKLRSIPDAAGRAYNAGGSDRARAELLRKLLSDKLAFKTSTIGSGGLEFTDD